MAGPQRHRLLQGYPMLPLLRRAVPESVLEYAHRRADGELRLRPVARPDEAKEAGTPGDFAADKEPWIRLDDSRPLLVGVMPHTQCNPRVSGCGFCTFPHDNYNKTTLRRTAHAVARQVDEVFRAYPNLAKRPVEGVYFGGATANLTPRDDLASIGQALARHLDLSRAEITLEGVPSLFRSLFSGPFEALLEMPARHRRVSMGVQTFDDAMLARMGRQAFGGEREVARVVDKAHRRGMTASGDFLINLPGEPRAQMIEDIERAAAMGLDQICVYHLVVTDGQGTPWSRDEAVRASLPSVESACENWLAVREALLARGHVQSTLTNFERADVHATDRRFVYEEKSYTPDLFDALGFGPHAISTFMDLERRRAVKLVRGIQFEYDGSWGGNDLVFTYAEEDLRLLFVTRTLARLRVPRPRYKELFGADLTEHFGEALSATDEAGLTTLDADALHLTPRGMFFADSVAGLLAWPRALALRASGAGLHTPYMLFPRRRYHDGMG